MANNLSTLITHILRLQVHAWAFQQQASLTSVDKKVALLEITNCWHWMYTTEIAVGNPPIKFRAIVETAASDIMLPSANCSEPSYCDTHPLYNSSQSLTYQPDGRSARVGNGLYYSWGYASVDSFHIGDLEVKGQTFEEATRLRPSYFFPQSWHDSALTLAREIVYDEEDTNLSVPSPFQNVVQQGLLVENVFSLKLPRKVHEKGLLIVGSRPDDFDTRSALELPLLDGSVHQDDDEEGRITSGGWEVEPVYLHFGTGKHEIYYDLYGYTALFTTWPPFLGLPNTFAEWVMDHIGADKLFHEIKCDAVTPALPNITIALRGVGGRVEEFTLTYADYATDIFRLPLIGDEYCQLPFRRLQEGDKSQKRIILGPVFLRKYWSIFDEGRKSVFCKCLLPHHHTRHR